ncbi:MAG: GNAT family N-acetyltransferase [Clostridia bacterium]|nr:GNAT family N-acetyltransferase [Clostridia bacterium]
MNRIGEIFTRPPRLYTPRLILRAMTRRDADDMFEYARDPGVTRYLLWAPHEDRDYTKRYLKSVEAAYRRGDFYDFGVELSAEGKFIGTCGIASVDLPNNTAEIGYVINPRYQNKGYATEAARAVIKYCFEELRFNRVEARYMIGNDQSRRVMDKCGMRFEGVRRSSLFVRDGYVDVGVSAMTASDYFSPHY